MIADVAAVFHWPLGDLLALDVEDLAAWRDRAVARWNSMNSSKGD